MQQPPLPNDCDDEREREQWPDDAKNPDIDGFVAHAESFRRPDEEQHATTEYFLDHVQLGPATAINSSAPAKNERSCRQ